MAMLDNAIFNIHNYEVYYKNMLIIMI